MSGPSIILTEYKYAKVTADGLVASGKGTLHTVTFSATGTVTAGVITIYDSLTEANTAIWAGTIQTALNPTTITLDVNYNTGLYIGYDGSIANVSTTVSFTNVAIQ